MTKSSLLNTNISRELSDFVFYSGHGGVASNNKAYSYLFLGGTSTVPGNYGVLWNYEWNFGANATQGTRWAWFEACETLYGCDNTANYQSAFKGLQFILGYRSISFDFAACADPFMDYFWNKVSGSSATWRDAYFDAVDRKVYQALMGMVFSNADGTTSVFNGTTFGGIEPAIVSAKNSAGTAYCDKTFLQTTNEKAATGNLVSYRKVFGLPLY